MWEHLYSLDRERAEKRDQSHLERQLQEEQRRLEKCTFQPEINAEAGARQRSGIYDRTLQWKQSVEEKYFPAVEHRLKKIRSQNEQEEEKECVFKPELSTRLDVSPAREVKGVDKFVERQKIASDIKREKEALLNKDAAKNWTKKVTVPEGFSFTNSVVFD